jgi:hypothetical protein
VVEGEKFSRFGTGTYSLKFYLPSDVDETMAIYIGDFFSSYEMYVNDQLISQAGIVSETRDQSIAEMYPRVRFITVNPGMNLITIKVANFHQSNGGAWGQIYLGSNYNIHFFRVESIALQMFYFGLLFIMGWYHIIQFLLRKDDKTSLVFGLFALVLALRQALIQGRLVTYLLPHLSFEVLLSLEYLTYYVGVSLFTMFLYLTFKD